MASCVAYGCVNRNSRKGLQQLELEKTRKITFHKFPRNNEKRQLWIKAVRRENWEPSAFSVLCSVHFSEDCFDLTSLCYVRLRENAVPTVFPAFPPHVQQKHFAPDQRTMNEAIFKSDPLEEAKTHIHYSVEQPNKDESNFKSHRDIFIPGVNCEDSGIEMKEEMSDDIDEVCKRLHLEITENGVKSFQSRKRKPETDGLELETNSCKVENELVVLRQEFGELQDQSNQLEKQLGNLEHNLNRVFHQDQICVLLSKPNIDSSYQWSEETLQMGLGLRFLLGTSGYNCLLDKNYPLPSVESMRLQLQGKSSMLSKIFKLLKVKVSHMKDEDKRCVLLLDEVKCDGKANSKTRMLMTLRSLRGRWQQIVSDSIMKVDKKKPFPKRCVTDIVKVTEELGLKVYAITLNIGDVLMNKFYTAFNLTCGRSGPVVNHFPNPRDPSRNIYVVPHVMNVIQRTNNILMRVGSIRLSSKTVEVHQLSSSSVEASHIKLLTEHMDRIEEKLNASSTSEGKRDTECKISQGLNYLVENENFDVALKTTAWFVELGDKWFEMMTEKERLLALTKKRPEEYEDKINLLNAVVDIYRSMLFGIDSLWRDIQSQVVFASKSVLDIQKIVLGDHMNDFFQTAVVTMGRGPLLPGHTIDCNALCLEEFLMPVSEFDFDGCIMAIKDELEASDLVELFQ